MKARDFLANGDLVGAYTELAKSITDSFRKGACPGCNAQTDVLVKSGHEAGECSSCGAAWGKRAPMPVGALVKSARHASTQRSDRNVNHSKGRPEVEAKLWELWRRTGGEGVEAWAINSYSATGIISKSLLEKIGIHITDAEAGEALSKSEPQPDGRPEPTYGGLSKFQALETMLQMFKSGEDLQHVNRHSIAKMEQFGILEGEALRSVLRKAGKDPDAMSKGPAPKLEDQEGTDPEITDPGKDPREEPKARFGAQTKPETKRAGGIGTEMVQKLVFENPANGDGQAIASPKEAKLSKAAVDLATPAAPPHKDLGHHFIFAVDSPAYPEKRQIVAGHEQVLHGLRRQGMNAREAKGKYGGKAERSIVVHDPKEHDVHTLHVLAHNLGQESAIHSDGQKHRLYYYHGDNAGKYHEGQGTEWASHEPEDNYTELADGDSGQRAYFRHNFDFNTLHDHVDDGQKVAGLVAKSESDDEVAEAEVVDALSKTVAQLADLTKSTKSMAPAPSAPKRDEETLMKDPMEKGKDPSSIRGTKGGAKAGFGLDPAKSKPTPYTAPGGLTSGHAKAKELGVKPPKLLSKGPGLLKPMAAPKTGPAPMASAKPITTPVGPKLGKSVPPVAGGVEKSRGVNQMRDVTGMPEERAKLGADMKAGRDATPSQSWARDRQAGDPNNPIQQEGLWAGYPKSHVGKPTGPVAGIPEPKPAVAAEAAPAKGKKKLKKSGATKGIPPSADNKAIEQKQSQEPEATAHSLTTPKPPAEKKVFDPASLGIDPKTGRKLIKPMKKSEAMDAIQAKMTALNKSMDPTAHLLRKHLAELAVKIDLAPGDEVTLFGFDEE